MEHLIEEIIRDDEELKDLLKDKVKEAMKSEEFQDSIKSRICNLVENLELDDLYETLNTTVSDYVGKHITNNIGLLFGQKSKKKKENKQ